MALIFSPSTKNIGFLALSAALVSGFATAVNMVITKQMPYNATQSTVMLWVTSVIANIVMAFVFSESIPLVGWHAEWVYLFIFAAASVIASWSFVRGMKLIEAGAAGILGLLEIVFGVLFGIIFFNERLETIVLIGIATIIAAAAIPYIRDYNAKRGSLS